MRWWGELAGGIVLSFFHNYLGAERQRESEQVPEELTLKATSPEEPRASGPLFLLQLSRVLLQLSQKFLP